ncbi:5954_t:CDS:2, partial [Cetraspora pellucida]
MSPPVQPTMKSALSSSQQTKVHSMANPRKPVQLYRPISPLQQTKTLSISSPTLNSSRPLSPTQKSTRPISPSKQPLTPQLTKYQSLLPPSISPPDTPPQSPRLQVHSVSSLGHQRSLPLIRPTQSQPLSPQPQEKRNSQPSSPIHEDFYRFPSPPKSPRSPKLQIHASSVAPSVNLKSPENSSPVLEPFNLKQKHLFTLVSRADLALISGWIDDSANTKEIHDDEILENSLACKYNISNRNLIMNTTPMKHKSSFSRVSQSKYAVSLGKNTGPAFGTTDLIMKDGEVKCKPDCYSLDLLEKIDGDMDLFNDEFVKTYKIEEYE